MIYVNGRFLLQNLTGVNRFAYELCRAWVRMGIPFTLCCPPGTIKECYDVSCFHIVVCGWGKSHVWEQLALPYWFAKVKGEKFLVCFTGLGPLLTRKKIMTIHDLAFMANPAWYSRSYRLWYRLMTPLCAATSVRILTVSQFSKSEIRQRLSISEKNHVTETEMEDYKDYDYLVRNTSKERLFDEADKIMGIEEANEGEII